MLKRRSKHFALLLVLAMLATMFVGVGTASAATENVALTIPSVGTSATAAAPATLGTLKIRETSSTAGSIDAGQQVTINLPSGVEYVTDPSTVVTANADITADADLGSYISVDGAGLANGDVKFVSGSSKSLTIEVESRTAAQKLNQAEISFLFNTANSKVTLDAPDADIAIEIYAPNSGISQGKVIVAKSSSAGTTATVMDTSTVSNGANKTVGTIRIAENRAASIAAGDVIKVVAPDDITIVSVIGDCTFANWTAAGFTFGVAENSDGYSQLSLTCVTPTASGTTPGFVNIDLKVDVDDRDLTGPIEFTVKGDHVTTQKLTVGKVSDYSVEVVAKGDPKTVKAGFSNMELQDLTIKEGLADSFVDARDFVLELPSWAHWYAAPTVTVEKGNGAFAKDQGGADTYDNQRNKITFTYTAAAGPTKTEFTFEDLKVFIDPDAPAGDLVVKADGKALGGSFEAVLGKVVKPVTATAAKADVKIGLAGQAAPDITITESEAGMLKYQINEIASGWDKDTLGITANQAATLKIDLPDGVKFSKTPTVKVTAGDLKLKADDIELSNNNNTLDIPVDKTSSVASTIVVSDIQYTLDRTVPEGDVDVVITGKAVDCTADSNLQFDDPCVKLSNATTVTPAPGDYKNEVSFVIGASSYKLNGVDQAMDVAPYIKDSRTYMPIRYVAYALGITDANILWDGANQTVTLMKGDKVVQLKVGSTSLIINGAAVTMDVAPEISNSRTMLPISFVANAFGATASWDAATQTVTIK